MRRQVVGEPSDATRERAKGSAPGHSSDDAVVASDGLVLRLLIDDLRDVAFLGIGLEDESGVLVDGGLLEGNSGLGLVSRENGEGVHFSEGGGLEWL